MIKTKRLLIYPANRRHLKFLQSIWNDSELMQYAGFAKDWSVRRMHSWHAAYRERVLKYGTTEVQFIIKLKKGTLIGESGIGRMKSGWSCPGYKAPMGKLVLMCDVKLKKPYWNVGYGTEAMRAIVIYVFSTTNTDVFLVPPHKNNPPAIRVYEKSGFRKTRGIWYRRHLIYEMTRKYFRE